VSFVCSLVSLLSFSAAIAAESVALLYLFGFFALGAVVLGIVGLSYDYQYHGLAIAGLVLGSFELALVAIILALVAAFNG